MKNLKQFMLLVMTISMVSLTSCNKNDDGGDGGGGSTASGTISAKIDGEQFTSLEITSFANATTGGGQTTMILQGNSSSQAINMIIIGYNGVGTYELSNDNVFISSSYTEVNASNPTNSQIWNAPYQDSGVIGQIQISEDTDTNVVGTFHFTGKNTDSGSTKSITEGSFNLDKM